MKKPKVENKRETYFLGVYRGKRLHAIKIGLASRGQANRRIKNLQTGSVDGLVLLAVCEGSLERKFHRQFSGYKMKGEFFKPAPALLKLIADLKQIRELVAEYESTTGSDEGSKGMRKA